MPDANPKTTDAPPRNPSPKQRFQQNTRLVKDYVGILDNPAFQVALDAALLEYQQLVSSQAKDALSASAAGFKIQGALEFVRTLKTLADTEVPTRRRDMDNLQEH